MSLPKVFAEIAQRQQRFHQALRKGQLRPEIGRTVQEHYAYVYKRNTLGMGRSGAAEPTSADDSNGSISFTISVYDEDRDGDLVVPPGCRLHNYARNPVVFFGHQQWEIPVGVSRAPDGRITVFPLQDRIKALVFFDREDPDADFLYGKVKRGILSAASIAFVPLEAYRRDEVEKATPHANRPLGMPLGWFFKSYDLTEWSIVGVPSCASAIRDALDSEKSFLSPRLQKGLSAYAAQTQGCWNGWCPVLEEKVMASCNCRECQHGQPCSCGKGQKSQKDMNQALMEPGGIQGAANPPPGPRPSKDAADMQVVQRPDGWYVVDPDEGHEDGPYASQEEAQHHIEFMTAEEHTAPTADKGGQPSSDIDPGKARQILADGTIHGKPLTDAQRGMFGAAAGRGKKALSTTSGQVGGYTLDNSGKAQEDGGSGEPLSETNATGYEACSDCEGSGNCSACGGWGTTGDDAEDCPSCDGTGNCPGCDGMGLRPKNIHKSVRKAPMATADNEDEDTGIPQAHEAGKELNKPQDNPDDAGVPQAYEEGKNVAEEPLGETGSVTPPYGVGAKGSESEPFNPKPSARVAAALYSHYKAAMDYLDQELVNMDNPGMKAWLDGHKEHLHGAMQHLADGLAEHHPDHDLEKLCKAIEAETNPTPDQGLQGERGLVGRGDVPPAATGEDPGLLQSDDEGMDLGTLPVDTGGGQESDYPGSAPPTAAPFQSQETPEEEAGALYGTPRVEEDDFRLDPQDTGLAPYQGGKGGDMGDSGIPDSDADTEEILERYRHPKSGQMMVRKIGRIRRTKDGKTFFVRYPANQQQAVPARKKLERPTTGEFIEGEGGSDELDEGETPAPYNKQLARDVNGAGEFLADMSTDVTVPKAYRTVSKFHAERLGYVSKQLSNAGKLQRNGGSGRTLADKGKVQHQGGGGEQLGDKGKPQRDSRSRAQIVGSGTPDGLTGVGRPPYNNGKKAAPAPAKAAATRAPVQDPVLEEFAAVKRMFQQYGLLADE